MLFIYLKRFKGHSWSLLLFRFLVVGSIQQPFLVDSCLCIKYKKKYLTAEYFFLLNSCTGMLFFSLFYHKKLQEYWYRMNMYLIDLIL